MRCCRPSRTRSDRAPLGRSDVRRRARVHAGVVLDDLRRRAERHGLTFGPDPATHDRCTFGGMIGNNSCGVHAMLAEFYGPGPRTEDSVVELEVLTYDGLRMRVGPTSDAEYAEIQREGGRRAELYRGLRELVERHGDAIREGFPRIPRRVSGYNLPALLPEHGFNVARALVGSEGTCVAVLEGTDRDLELLRRMGLHVDEPEPGCCGMAGSFGYEAGKYEVSRAIGELRLLPAVRAAEPDALLVADGFSCREQISQLAGRTALHLGELLAAAQRDSAGRGRRSDGA